MKSKFIATLLCLSVLAAKLPATTFYVNVNNSAPLSPYTSWASAATNIQNAIDAATNGDLVLVTNGVYTSGGQVVYGSATNAVVVNKALTVQSVNGPSVTSILGTNGRPSTTAAIRCAYLTNGAVLSGFTLSGGATRLSGGNTTNEDSGGGVWCESSNSIVTNCVLSGNYAAADGGAAYRGTYNNCVIISNTATLNGGGTYLANLNGCVIASNTIPTFALSSGGGGSTFGTLNNCLVVWNSAGASGTAYGGGALYATLNYCVVSNNTVHGDGGGVAYGVANWTLIANNYATAIDLGGGGAYTNILNDCLLINNSSGSFGGGATYCLLNNCTVVSNSATDGGGVAGGDVTNCIVYFNNAPTYTNYDNHTFGQALSYCDTYPAATGSGNLTNTPVFLNPAAGDFHLQSNSPCINSGNNFDVTNTTDFDGNPRIVGGTVDMGSYEYQSPTSQISYAWLQQYALPTDGSVDFTNLDGTGFDVYQDWVAGLNPTNPASVLTVQPPAATNNTGGITVNWQSVNTRTYYLQRSTNLLMSFSVIKSNLPGQAGATSYTDVTATNAGPYFYRIGVQQGF